MTIALLILYFAAPLVLQALARRVSLIDKIGVVTVCYAVGLIVGNIPGVHVPEQLTTRLIEVVVPLSIPLLLFSSDFKVFRSVGGTLLKAFACAIVAVAIAVTLGTLLFRGSLAETWKLGSMMMGVYTGGTPNMSAIGLAVGVPHETFVILNAADLLYGGVWLLFLLSAGKAVVGKILRPTDLTAYGSQFELDEAIRWPGSALGLMLSVVILGTAVGLSMLITGHLDEMVVLLTITTLGIAAAAFPRVRQWRGSFGLGNYLLLVFCVAVGSIANVQKIIGSGPDILAFVGLIMGVTILLHLLFSYWLRIDTDAMIIASAAGIFGPAFIAPVARALRNPLIIPLGLALALLGFAIGNYCGIAMSHLLRLL
ncbi:MAG: DUF819 family protein [Saprospiraceae bacterium]|nr:DUF819 family protein [Saprospiraceae bacterium]